MIKIAQYYDRSPTKDNYMIQFSEGSQSVECGQHVFMKTLKAATDTWNISNPAVNMYYCTVPADHLEWLQFLNPDRPQKKNLDAVRAAKSTNQDPMPCTGTPGR